MSLDGKNYLNLNIRMKKNKKLFAAKAIKIDINVWESLKVLLNETQAWEFGITTLDKIKVLHHGEEIVLDVDLTNELVDFWKMGITNDVHKQFWINEWDIITIEWISKASTSVRAIKKKLLWKKLNKKEIYSLVKDMSEGKLSDVLVSYYAACSFCYPSDEEELYYTAKYSADFWDKIDFKHNTAVKYSVWWLPGNETTMIIVPILASLWIYSPKTFTKSITSPAATWECVETLMNINLDVEQMYDCVNTNTWCLAWGKNLKFAPANDKIIKVSYPLSMEAYSKMLVSIIAKVYAWGTKNCLIEIPVWPKAKITSKKIANRIKKHFQYIAKRLDVNLEVVITDWTSIVGRWVWAVLQVREVLRILQGKKHNSQDLEDKAVLLASKLVELSGLAKWNKAKELVLEKLKSGEAWESLQKIINYQNNLNWSKANKKMARHLWIIDSEELPVSKHSYDLLATNNGVLGAIDLETMKTYARELGCPVDRKAWFYFHKKPGDKYKKWDLIYTIYSSSKSRLNNVKNQLMEVCIYRCDKKEQV